MSAKKLIRTSPITPILPTFRESFIYIDVAKTENNAKNDNCNLRYTLEYENATSYNSSDIAKDSYMQKPIFQELTVTSQKYQISFSVVMEESESNNYGIDYSNM